MPLSPPSLHSTASPISNTPSSGLQAKQPSGFHLWGEDGFTFGDILDVINPLQHLPVISTVYRAITGDTISPASRVLGDGLFGGPIGAAVGAANALLEYESGKDVGEHMLALLHIQSHVQDGADGATKVSQNDVAPSPSSAPVVPAATVAARQTSMSPQAASRDQFMAALDAYARNNSMLSAAQRQIPQSRVY